MKENEGAEFKLTADDYRKAEHSYVPLAIRKMILAHGGLALNTDPSEYHRAETKDGRVFETSYEVFAAAIHGAFPELTIDESLMLENYLGQLLEGEVSIPFGIRGSTAMKIIRPEVEIDNGVNTLLGRAISLTRKYYPQSEALEPFRKISTISDLDLVLDLHLHSMQDVKNKLINNFNLQVEFSERKATGTDISLAVVMITFPSGKKLKVDLFPFPYDNVQDGRAGTLASERDVIILKVFKHEIMDGVKRSFIEVNGLAKKFAHIPNSTRFPPEELRERSLPHSEVIALYLRMLAQAVQFPPTGGHANNLLGVTGWSLYGNEQYGFDLLELINSYRKDEKFNIEARAQQIAKDMAVLLYFHWRKGSLDILLIALTETGLIQYFPYMRTYVDLNALFNIRHMENEIRIRKERKIAQIEQTTLTKLYIRATEKLSNTICSVISPLIRDAYPEFEPIDAECAHTFLKLCTPKLPGQMVPGTYTPLSFLSSN